MRSVLDGEVLVAYARRGDALLHVADVVSGLACDCVCVRCGQPMVARKGAIRRHHFAHARDTDCDGGAETILHRLAKELVAELAAIRLPEYRYRYSYAVAGHGSVSIDRIVVPAQRVDLGDIYLEQPLGTIIPDVVLEPADRRVLIEFAVTAPVDRAKLRAVRPLDLALLQIRLSPRDAGLARDALRAKLEIDNASKEWLFHPRQREAEREWLRRRRELLRAARRARRARDVVLNQALDAARRAPVPAWMQTPEQPSAQEGGKSCDSRAHERERITGQSPTLDDCPARAQRKSKG